MLSKAKTKRKLICTVKQQPQGQPQKSHKQDNLQINQSLPPTAPIFGDFYESGTQDAEVTKSLIFITCLFNSNTFMSNMSLGPFFQGDQTLWFV